MIDVFREHIFHIIIIGCGGTGGNLATRLCQFLVGVPKDRYLVTLVDEDSVSLSNLCRQPYLYEDLNKCKSEALASLLSQSLELNIRAVPRYINSWEDIEQYVKTSHELYNDERWCGKFPVPVICGCVDNMHARKCMHEYFEKTDTVIYIDSGNEFSYGEVVFGAKKKGKVLSPDKTFYFPDMFEQADLTPRSEESCEDLNSSDDRSLSQHLCTNLTASTVMLTGLCSLFSSGRFPTGIVHFDTFNFFMRQDEYVPPRDELKSVNVLGGEDK